MVAIQHTNTHTHTHTHILTHTKNSTWRLYVETRLNRHWVLLEALHSILSLKISICLYKMKYLKKKKSIQSRLRQFALGKKQRNFWMVIFSFYFPRKLSFVKAAYFRDNIRAVRRKMYYSRPWTNCVGLANIISGKKNFNGKLVRSSLGGMRFWIYL